VSNGTTTGDITGTMRLVDPAGTIRTFSGTMAFEFEEVTPPIPPVPQNVYYVQPGGDDSNDGSKDHPWRTIGKANAALRAGDTVNIWPDVYNEVIWPDFGGERDAMITYRKDPAAASRPVIVGMPGIDELVHLAHDYIEVNGFVINYGHDAPKNRWEWVQVYGNGCELWNCDVGKDLTKEEVLDSGLQEFAVAVYGDDCAVNDCQIHGIYFGLTVRPGCRRLTVADNHITELGGCGLNIFQSDGEMRGLLVERNVIGGVLVGDCIQFQGFSKTTGVPDNIGAIIRGNVLFDAGENAIDLKSAEDVVIEDNYIWGCIGSNDGPLDGWNRYALQTISVGGPHVANRIIIRRNVMIDSCNGIEVQGDDYKVYHNTFTNNNRDFTGSNSTAYDRDRPLFCAVKMKSARQGLVVRNNIFAEHFSAEVSLWRPGSNPRVDYNLYWNPDGLTLSDQHDDGWTRYNDLVSWRDVTGQDGNSQEANPMFVNVPAKPTGDPRQFDFHLLAGSPAIDAGAPLTRTIGGGNGYEVTVEDAALFMDGYTVADGDLVKVGDNLLSQVIGIDYEANVLTLSRSVVWTDGDPVYLGEFSGEAPDLGAYEGA
jgi:hypothetical protein